MCYFGTNNPFLIDALCVILPTGQWVTPHYSQPATEEWMHLTTLWDTRNTSNIENHIGVPRCVIFYHIIQSRYLLIGGTPKRPVRNANYSQPATEEIRLYGVIGHTKDWKPCVWDPMCYFGTNNPFLIDASCVILPTGQWVTPHYSQPATEEWIHLTALWVTWNTLNIENHLAGSICVIFDHVIQSRCLSHRGDSQPASEERPLLQTGHWGTAAVWGDKAH